MISIPIEIGDIVRVGRFKNKRIKVKTIEYDEYGLPLINGRPLLTMRIEKLMQEPTQESKMNKLQHIKHTQFVENVLGINLTLEETCTLMEGVLPNNLKERILLETQIYESFLDSLATVVGNSPMVKTIKDGASFFNFIYNVIGDKSGENLKKANRILVRNCTALYTKATKLGDSLPAGKIKETYTSIVEWLNSKVKSIISVQSDTDPNDNLKGEGSNWKKFILLLLVGMVLILLKSMNSVLASVGADILEKALTTIWNLTKDLAIKFLSAPVDLIKFTSGAALMKVLIPLISTYKTIKLLQTINGDLLDSGAWLRKA